VIATKNQCYNNTAGILVVLLPGLNVKESENIQVINNHVYNNNLPNTALLQEIAGRKTTTRPASRKHCLYVTKKAPIWVLLTVFLLIDAC
jgi:hypothetical protein